MGRLTEFSGRNQLAAQAAFGARSFVQFRTPALLALVLLVGAILHSRGLGDRTIWLDEGYGIFYSSQSWAYIWHKVPELEVHLPFLYSIRKLWREIVGSGEAALRTPAALASLGVVFCLFAAGRIVCGPRNGAMLGLMAAALFALWQMQIELARDARPYAFSALGIAMTMAGLLHVLKYPDRYRDWPWNVILRRPSSALALLALALGMALMLWSHNVGAIAVLANTAFIAAWWAFSQRFDLRLFATLGTCGLLVAALFAPGVPLLLSQTQTVSDHYWQNAPSVLDLMSISTKAVVQSLDYYNERLGADLDFRPMPERFPARSDDYVYVTGNKGSAAVDENRLAMEIAAVANTRLSGPLPAFKSSSIRTACSRSTSRKPGAARGTSSTRIGQRCSSVGARNIAAARPGWIEARDVGNRLTGRFIGWASCCGSLSESVQNS